VAARRVKLCTMCWVAGNGLAILSHSCTLTCPPVGIPSAGRLCLVKSGW